MTIKISELINFWFIRDQLWNKYFTINGYTAESPLLIFNYLLLKKIYTVSAVNVVECLRFNIPRKYFSKMLLAQEVINPNTLTKFKKLCLTNTDFINLSIDKTIFISVEKRLISIKSINSQHSTFFIDIQTILHNWSFMWLC